jgi:glycosyltransferase involved in cell wall biosynthesis
LALVAALDASATRDGRAVAGIGRYEHELIEGLRGLAGRVAVHVAAPRRRPASDRWAYRYAAGQPALMATIMRARPAVVHGLASEASPCFPLRRQVVTVHDTIPWTSEPAGPTERAYLAAQACLLRRAGAVIVPGPPIARDVTEVLAIPSERVVVVPHGISAVFTPAAGPDDAAVRSRLGLAGEYLLWVGSLHGPDPRKGLDLLIEALGTLDAARRPPLALVGRAGAATAWAQELARAHGVATIATGYVDDGDLAAVYRGAVAAAVPSRYEGFGLTALEGLACGTPSVVTDAGSLPSVVGDAALSVAVGRADALAAGLVEVLGSAAVRERLAGAGPRRAAQFSWARTAEQTVEVYERLTTRC